jgi:hypothetical protein
MLDSHGRAASACTDDLRCANATGTVDKTQRLWQSLVMRTGDQGFGAVGVFALAIAIAILLTIGTPLSTTKESIELKDWLGFAGNLLGAIGTLIAAFIAWRAVQRQVDIQREHLLIGVLTREEERIERELPSINSAINLMHQVQAILDNCESPALLYDALKEFGLYHHAPTVEVFLMERIPALPASVRIFMANDLGQLTMSAMAAKRLSEPPDERDTQLLIDAEQQALKSYVTWLENYRCSLNIVFQLHKRIDRRLVELELFRSRIDAILKDGSPRDDLSKNKDNFRVMVYPPV